MEQRPLRLGDIVDDYCPRERRVTNHAIVAIVEDAIRQTRCTTCNTEHLFKGAHEPKRRLRPLLSRPSSPGGLIEVSAAATVTAIEPSAVEPALAPIADSPVLNAEPTNGQVETWAHRRLIRATLPKSESEPPPPRPIPEFTMHQRPAGRGGRAPHRPDQGRGQDFLRGRPLRSAPNGSAEAEDEDEVNGNVVGPVQFNRGGQDSPNNHANAPGGRRRRGRRRRGR